VIAEMPAPSASLTVLKHRIEPHIQAARDGYLVRDDVRGHYYRRPGLVRSLPGERGEAWQQRLLAWLRDHVDRGIPSAYYRTLLGHDIHLSAYSELFAQHYHTHQRDPFTGELGWLENLGRVSDKKLTIAFRNLLTAQLVTETSVWGDFKYHEVGTDATAESNAQTALIAASGIARVAGNQLDGTGTYTSAGTIAADTTEVWAEMGLFNAATGPTMLDRSVISPTVSVVALDTATFTHVTTFNSES
jgi:hypothetical protein